MKASILAKNLCRWLLANKCTHIGLVDATTHNVKLERKCQPYSECQRTNGSEKLACQHPIFSLVLTMYCTSK